MANIYNFSRADLLKRIGLSPSRKLLVFLLSSVAVTIPLGFAYNSLAIILFVLYSLLSARPEDFRLRPVLIVPIAFFLLMCLSLAWSIDFKSTVKALSKEASLLFIPLAFCINRPLNRQNVGAILGNYSLFMCLFGIYFIGRAVVRYIGTNNPGVFFYHELSTYEINATYLSALFSVALFYYVSKRRKSVLQYTAFGLIIVFIFLLSCKTIIIIDVLLILVYYLFYSGLRKKARIAAIAVFCILVAGLGYYGKIKERMQAEYYLHTEKVPDGSTAGIQSVSPHEAWTKDRFEPNHYFTGLAFRIYQIRIFNEMLAEDNIFFKGYGLNASLPKIEAKGVEHNVYRGQGSLQAYNKMNFHNQYIETFADLGIIGVLLLVLLLALNLKNSFKTKHFVHIAFAILMISLFLTESFLWRQRGVVFFTVFYCIFNTGLTKGYVKK